MYWMSQTVKMRKLSVKRLLNGVYHNFNEYSTFCSIFYLYDISPVYLTKHVLRQAARNRSPESTQIGTCRLWYPVPASTRVVSLIHLAIDKPALLSPQALSFGGTRRRIVFT